MSMLYSRTADNRKGTLADFFSILAFMLIILVFYFLFKFTENSFLSIESKSSKIEDSISLLNILKTDLEYQNSKISIAEMISQSGTDSSKYGFLEKEIVKLVEQVFGSSGCHMVCIDGSKIRSSGCSTFETYRCLDPIAIPGYKGPIEVSFQSNIDQPKPRQSPLK